VAVGGWVEWGSGNKFSCLPKHKPLASNTNPKQQITEITFAMQSSACSTAFSCFCFCSAVRLLGSTVCALICGDQSCHTVWVLNIFLNLLFRYVLLLNGKIKINAK